MCRSLFFALLIAVSAPAAEDPAALGIFGIGMCCGMD
jgi:hypothetical protein